MDEPNTDERTLAGAAAEHARRFVLKNARNHELLAALTRELTERGIAAEALHRELRSEAIMLCSRLMGTIDALAKFSESKELDPTARTIATALGIRLRHIVAPFSEHRSFAVGGLDRIAVSVDASHEMFRAVEQACAGEVQEVLEGANARMRRISEEWALSVYAGAARCADCDLVSVYGVNSCDRCEQKVCRACIEEHLKTCAPELSPRPELEPSEEGTS